MDKLKAYILLVINGLVWLIIFIATLPVAVFLLLKQQVKRLSNHITDYI